jgi:small-conductance mechanosensitive channel
MVRILLLLFIIFQAAISHASGPLAMPEQPILETVPKSKEIKKVTKLLEDPLEREKLIKTLKVLASAQEAEEKKSGGSLTAYFMPIVRMVNDVTSTFFMSLQQVSIKFTEFIDYLKSEQNRKDLWLALLLWFPIFIVVGSLLEKLCIWFIRVTYQTRKKKKKSLTVFESKWNYVGAKLVLPFIIPVLYTPLLPIDSLIKKWLIVFWVILYLVRITLQYKREVPILPISTSPEIINSISTTRNSLFVLLSGILVLGMGINVWDFIHNDGFLLPSVLFILFSYLALYLFEWQKGDMQNFLNDSRALPTVPHIIAPIINILIKWLPRAVLLAILPLGIDKILFEGSLWNQYTLETIGSLTILMVFLYGRFFIDSIAHLNLPGVSSKIQIIPSYVAHLRLPLVKVIQWIWHIGFFGALLCIWNYCFSSIFINIIGHPITKTITTVGLIWGILYLLWLALDFFVQFHTKPQMIKGKKRVPTIFAKTFGPMFHSVAKWIMMIVAFFITLESFGFDLKVLVYLMSALAFAVSLGSQSLVKDLINGFFALIDGSFAVGEVVTVGAHTGTVESLSLRAITLRHIDGSLQTIPFSEVGNIINRSRDFSIVSIDVAVSYRTEIGSVYEALSLVYSEMVDDPTFGKMVIEPLSVTGIDHFSDKSVHVTGSIKIVPDPFKRFAQEFNRRLKIHLDDLGIAPPTAYQEPWNNIKK